MPRRMVKRLKWECMLQTGSCCRQAENTHVELYQHGVNFAFSCMPHNPSAQLLMGCAPASSPFALCSQPLARMPATRSLPTLRDKWGLSDLTRQARPPTVAPSFACRQQCMHLMECSCAASCLAVKKERLCSLPEAAEICPDTCNTCCNPCALTLTCLCLSHCLLCIRSKAGCQVAYCLDLVQKS